MNAATAREVIAETLFIMDAGFLCFVGSYIGQQIREIGVRNLWGRLGNKAALAVALHVLGLMIIRGWSTSMYWMVHHGINQAALEDAYEIALWGLVLACVGMALCIRVFSPAKWGNWGWVITFCAALVFVGYMQGNIVFSSGWPIPTP